MSFELPGHPEAVDVHLAVRFDRLPGIFGGEVFDRYAPARCCRGLISQIPCRTPFVRPFGSVIAKHKITRIFCQYVRPKPAAPGAPASPEPQKPLGTPVFSGLASTAQRAFPGNIVRIFDRLSSFAIALWIKFFLCIYVWHIQVKCELSRCLEQNSDQCSRIRIQEKTGLQSRKFMVY